MYISIKTGEVIIKSPLFLSNNEIAKIVNLKAEWIYKKLQAIRLRNANKISGEVGILGKKYLLKTIYVAFKSKGLVVNSDDIEIYLPRKFEESAHNVFSVSQNLIDEYYMKIAIQEVAISINKIITITGLSPLNYKIKKLKSSWGNCSSKKIITINSRLMKFDRLVIDYVVLHEICHLKHMNHSKKFWALIEKYMPDYKLIRGILKKSSVN